MQAMARALLVTVLLAALGLLVPLAAVADPCPDCGPVQGCCPSLGCACCAPGAALLPVMVPVALSPAWTALVGDRAADRCPSADPRDVFHVPKSPPA
jgi:hypothetical protein